MHNVRKAMRLVDILFGISEDKISFTETLLIYLFIRSSDLQESLWFSLK